MYVKGPGESEFSSATFDCLNSPYASGSEASKQGYCKQITQSGTLTWYLENSEAKSEEKSAEYVISLENYNISGQSKATIDAAPEAIEFIEKETFCEYSGDNKLEVVVQMQQEAKLTTARYATYTLLLRIPYLAPLSPIIRKTQSRSA